MATDTNYPAPLSHTETKASWQRACACHLTRPAESFALAEQALAAAMMIGDSHSAAWAQLYKALAAYRWIGADLDILRSDFLRAASAMEDLGDQRGMRLASLGPAIIAAKHGRWADALREYEALVGHFDLTKIDEDNFYVLLGLSTAHIYCGNLSEGLRFGYVGIHVTRQLELSGAEVNMSLPLGVALMAARDLQEAAAIFAAAEITASKIDSPMLLKTVRNNRAVSLRRLGGAENLLEAERLTELVLAEPAAMIGGQQFAHFASAELFLITGKLDLAVAHLATARDILSTQKIEPLDEAKVNFIAGMIAARQGKMSLAIELLQRVDRILPAVSAWRFSDRAKVFDELAEALASQGRFEEAYMAQKKSSQDYLVNVDVLNRVQRVSTQVRDEISRVQAVQAAQTREALERRQLEASHHQLREQMEHAVRETETLKLAAMFDALTGLPNRRYLDDALPNILRLSKQTAMPLAVAYLDIDHFKLVNDTYGHAMGDEVLRGFGALVPHFLRGSDLFARHGGEEFCVALIGCGPDAAAKRLNALLDALRSQEFKCDSKTISTITFSGGIAVYPDDGIDLTQLMSAADRRLYAAKEGGRAKIWCTD